MHTHRSVIGKSEFPDEMRRAPGAPGIAPRWTSSAKSGVGTALGEERGVWFTISHGILNEIYYPRIDQACTRDMGLIVTARDGFFSEEKRHTRSETRWVADGIPEFHITNTCLHGRYHITKEIIADPRREVVLQRIRFVAHAGTIADYRIYALLAPHLNDGGADNTAWIGEAKGIPMLFAERDGSALALATSTRWLHRSAGFVGTSDGWHDLHEHGTMQWEYDLAERGNVALTGELELIPTDGACQLALGFGRNSHEAAHRAASALWDGYEDSSESYRSQWQGWQQTLRVPEPVDAGSRDLFRTSTAVLRTHQSEHVPGGIIASLSIPWGSAKGDNDLGGYHLVWPRDLVETAGALLAAGAVDDVRRVLRYLAVTQEPDGHWPQNMWLDGTPYWNGIQMDEAGFPILLVELAARDGALDADAVDRLWPMIRRAAGYIARNGPVTQQDRWEEDPGYAPFTLAVEIAALLAAAEFADEREPAVAVYLRETADAWNDSIERWTYVQATSLADDVGVDGYYVRIAPPEQADAASPLTGFVPIKNRPPGESDAPATTIISPDALALVRFGLRSADDPRIVNTVRMIDATLRVDLPAGPVWKRYNGDGYGEHADGAPFDGTGVGRPWPLLTGERAHYELAAGRRSVAESLCNTFSRFASDGGLLPEQVWDGEEIPDRELAPGRPSGSAMPLVWAHSEYIKLRRSLADGHVFDMPPQPVERYQVLNVTSGFTIWRFNHKCTEMRKGSTLRVELLAAATVHWSSDGWNRIVDTPTRDTGLGIFVADLDTAHAPAGATVRLTFHWTDGNTWDGHDYSILVSVETLPDPTTDK